MAFPYKLYLVTDESLCLGRDLAWVVEEAVKGGVDVVQIREKDLPEKEFTERTLQLQDILARYNVPLIINDNVEIAIRCQANGVHVGNSDMPPGQIRIIWPGNRIIGYSIEKEEQVNSNDAIVSDYLALSPVFSTETKTDTIVEWGLEGISRIRSITDKPLVAIGSVKLHNAASIIEAGADCLAVVSAICSAPEPAKTAEQFRNEIEKVIKK